MATETVPSLHRAGVIPSFFSGLGLPWRARHLIRASPPLRRLSIICAAVTAVTLVLVVVGVLRYSEDALGALWVRPTHAWRYLWDLVRFALIFVGIAVGVNAGPLLVLAPWQDVLSESTEVACRPGGPSAPAGFFQGLVVAWAHTLQRLAALVAGHLVLLALHFIPVAGSLLWTSAAVLWTAAWLAVEYVDIAAARHRVPLLALLRALRRHLPFVAGFGLGLYILLWVPVLNFFLVPLAVVSGTQLFCGLQAAGTLPPTGRMLSS